jgi:hypothetical protein
VSEHSGMPAGRRILSDHESRVLQLERLDLQRGNIWVCCTGCSLQLERASGWFFGINKLPLCSCSEWSLSLKLLRFPEMRVAQDQPEWTPNAALRGLKARPVLLR